MMHSSRPGIIDYQMIPDQHYYPTSSNSGSNLIITAVQAPAQELENESSQQLIISRPRDAFAWDAAFVPRREILKPSKTSKPTRRTDLSLLPSQRSIAGLSGLPNTSKPKPDPPKPCKACGQPNNLQCAGVVYICGECNRFTSLPATPLWQPAPSIHKPAPKVLRDRCSTCFPVLSCRNAEPSQFFDLCPKCDNLTQETLQDLIEFEGDIRSLPIALNYPTPPWLNPRKPGKDLQDWCHHLSLAGREAKYKMSKSATATNGRDLVERILTQNPKFNRRHAGERRTPRKHDITVVPKISDIGSKPGKVQHRFREDRKYTRRLSFDESASEDEEAEAALASHRTEHGQEDPGTPSDEDSLCDTLLEESSSSLETASLMTLTATRSEEDCVKEVTCALVTFEQMGL
ncbi:unnamed protein product [Periconia digitata]|uniref:Uncharacterized protein n=1 Tax=Periconia digitata TaxID=1303443 RepID=A0A9W4XQM0_9PLEO|nr:unnamed protein product [Periconia digitata]